MKSLKLLCCILNLLLSGTAAAAMPTVWQLVTPQNEAQKAWVQTAKGGQWKAALPKFEIAFQNTDFLRSAEGRGVKSYLLVKNGLPILGFEYLLMRVSSPKNLSKELLQLLQIEVQAKPEVLDLISVKINPEWKVALGIREIEKFENDWQSFLNKASDVSTSVREERLKSLLSAAPKVFDRDRLYLALGRVLYQKQKWSQAIEAYKQVSKDSDYWVEAKEELAWANLLMNQHGSALAELKTLQAPILGPIVGPEPFFLTALIKLKLCDYEGLYKDLKDFRSRFVKRIEFLERAEREPMNQDLKSNIEKVVASGTEKSLGPQVEMHPRLFFRDRVVRQQIQLAYSLRRERAQAQSLITQFDEQDSGSEIARTLERFVERSVRREGFALNELSQRTRILARRDLAEMKKMIAKMHLIEAEAIQRISMNEPLKDSVQNEKIAGGRNTLVFPDSEEVWLDELDHYKVKAKGCPKEARTL